MTEELDPLQAQAIHQALGGRDVEVSERDFRRPRRFSPQVREGLKRCIDSGLPQIEVRINSILGSVHPLQLDHVRETSAEGLFDELESPLAALTFMLNGDPAWLVWDSSAAVACVEKVLGCPTDNPEGRSLSMVEAKILEQLLTPVAVDVARSLGKEAKAARIVQSLEGLGSWRDGERLDAHRLEVSLGFLGPGKPSSLKLYLPDIKPDAAGEIGEDTGELPAHLNNVVVDVCAHLVGCEVSLDQLLALEKGDVIPIESRVGDPAHLTVEGLILAKAAMGQHRGQLAVRIEKLETEVEEMP